MDINSDTGSIFYSSLLPLEGKRAAIFLGVFVILLAFKLFWDWRARVKFKRVINHGRSAAIDSLIYLLLSWYLFRWEMFGPFVIALALRWILFDLFYNLIFGNYWAYCGESSLLDKWLDLVDFKNDNRCVIGFILKFVLLALGIILYLNNEYLKHSITGIWD